MNYFSNFIICMMPLILQTLAAIKSSKTQARNIGSVGFTNAAGNTVVFENFDCPCGCAVQQISGRGDTFFLRKDESRCGEKPLFFTNQIAESSVLCPCGCIIQLKKLTLVTIGSAKAACKKNHIATIDGDNINCPCGCKGQVHTGNFYTIFPSHVCPGHLMDVLNPKFQLPN